VTDQTAEAFTPPAARGLPAGTLEAAEIGANRLDAWARTPRGRNFLAHALVQLARTGWLRQEPGDGFEPMTDRPTAEPAAPAVQAPATDRAAPAVWVDGHPQLEAIAAAVWERCGRSDSGMCVEDDPRNIAVAALAAVLPAPTDRAAVLPPPALTEEGRLRARVQVLEEDAERAQGLAKVGARCMREGHQGLIESGRAVIEGHRFALSVALGLGTGAPWDAIHERVAELRRMADEAQMGGSR
jgi:hypothetical protein